MGRCGVMHTRSVEVIRDGVGVKEEGFCGNRNDFAAVGMTMWE